MQCSIGLVCHVTDKTVRYRPAVMDENCEEKRNLRLVGGTNTSLVFQIKA